MLVTVGMPTLNGADSIDRALNSLRQQSYTDLEILVSDNGSSDSTCDIVLEHAKRDERIRLIHGPQISAAQNFARVLGGSRGEAFMWAADDDVWHPNFVEIGAASISAGSSYFIPNWWVGCIASNRGYSPDTNLLRIVQDTNRASRVLQYTNLHHHSHKCNIVYALFETAFLKRAHSMQSMANDGALGTVICSLASGETTDEVLFFKENATEGANFLKRLKTLAKQHLAKSVTARADPYHAAFAIAKEQGLTDLIRVLPEYSKAFSLVFEQYGPYATRKSFEILPDVGSLIRDHSTV